MKLKKITSCVLMCLLTIGMSAQGKTSLKVGDPSPDFINATDRNMKEVHVSDFKGKYIYVDVWATWCGPCKYEIPHLKELAEKMKGKKIVFVSISCEKNRGKWLEMLRIEQMGEVQINTSGDSSFQDLYGIRGIPRFMLLDKKGRIVNMNMTRPSDPQTEKTLRALKGI